MATAAVEANIFLACKYKQACNNKFVPHQSTAKFR